MKNKLFNEIIENNIDNLNMFLKKYPTNPSDQEVLLGIQNLKTLL